MTQKWLSQISHSINLAISQGIENSNQQYKHTQHRAYHHIPWLSKGIQDWVQIIISAQSHNSQASSNILSWSTL